MGAVTNERISTRKLNWLWWRRHFDTLAHTQKEDSLPRKEVRGKLFNLNDEGQTWSWLTYLSCYSERDERRRELGRNFPKLRPEFRSYGLKVVLSSPLHHHRHHRHHRLQPYYSSTTTTSSSSSSTSTSTPTPTSHQSFIRSLFMASERIWRRIKIQPAKWAPHPAFYILHPLIHLVASCRRCHRRSLLSLLKLASLDVLASRHHHCRSRCSQASSFSSAQDN